MDARFIRLLSLFWFFFAALCPFYCLPAFAEPGAWNQKGLDFFRSGRFEEAVQAYERAIEEQPDYPVALNNLGVAQYRLGRFREAEDTLKKAIALKADYAQPVINLGLVYFRTGRYLQALQQYWSAKRIDPYYTKLRVTKRKAEVLLDEELDRHPADPRLLELKQHLECR